MSKSPFVYNARDDQYRAKFPLPDDGTPGTELWLEVVIGIDQETGGTSCQLLTCGRGGEVAFKAYVLASSYSPPIDGIMRALYGVARKRTIEVIEPIG